MVRPARLASSARESFSDWERRIVTRRSKGSLVLSMAIAKRAEAVGMGSRGGTPAS
jgi:hypothetical protein